LWGSRSPGVGKVKGEAREDLALLYYELAQRCRSLGYSDRRYCKLKVVLRCRVCISPDLGAGRIRLWLALACLFVWDSVGDEVGRVQIIQLFIDAEAAALRV
jgi:hypothetical protein